NASQNVPAVVSIAIGSVGKRRILKNNIASKFRQLFRAALFFYFVFAVHEFENFRRSSQRLLEIIVEQRKFPHRVVELEDSNNESNKHSGTHYMVGNLVAAYQEQQGDGDCP